MNLPPFPDPPESQEIQALRILYRGIQDIQGGIQTLMAQFSDVDAALARTETVINSTLPEIKSEIADLAAEMAKIAAAPTPEQMQSLVDRANALTAKVGGELSDLQADNPAPAPQPEPEPPAQTTEHHSRTKH